MELYRWIASETSRKEIRERESESKSETERERDRESESEQRLREARLILLSKFLKIKFTLESVTWVAFSAWPRVILAACFTPPIETQVNFFLPKKILRLRKREYVRSATLPRRS
jgi:hypothetical protein